jgi:hypothetical protein
MPEPGFLRRMMAGLTVVVVALTLAPHKAAAGEAMPWARGLGGNGVDVAHAIATDDAGNIYLTGSFSDSADFDPGPAVFQLNPSGGTDAFIVKLNAEGGFVWARRIGGSGGNTAGYGIAVDAAGAVHVTGEFSSGFSTVDFDPGPGTFP